ncbi:MAG TPA: hypothetical protein VGB37_14585 [Candidatus Lokiarchaeia archaeon]
MPEKEKNDCEIKVKRDKLGKVIGIKRSGKCTKEDVFAFAQQNDMDVKFND